MLQHYMESPHVGSLYSSKACKAVIPHTLKVGLTFLKFAGGTA